MPFQPRLDAHEILLRDEVRLVEEHPVGEGDLLDRLILGALGLLLVEVLLYVLRVDERHDAVERERTLTLSSTKKVCATGAGSAMPVVSMTMASSFSLPDCLALGELLEHDDEVLADGAADAAVHHLDDFLIGLHLGVLGKQRVVDAETSNFGVVVSKGIFETRAPPPDPHIPPTQLNSTQLNSTQLNSDAHIA